MLAVHARPDFPARPATRLPAGRARYLRERAALGAWAEVWDPRPEDGTWSQGIADFGVKAVAFAPIVHGDHVEGILAVGTTDPGFTGTLVDRLPSVADFSAAPSVLLGERMHVHRHRSELRRDLANLLAERAFSPVFQPIVELQTREVVGYEALTRFDSGQRPDLCFRDAWEVGLGPELELSTLAASIEEARALPAGRWLNLNVGPRLLDDATSLDRLLRRSDRPIVLEITEHEAVADYAALRDAVRSLGHDVWLAVDDAGAGIANFGHIVELRPDFVKLDISLVRGVNADVGRQALVIAMHHFARTAGCHLVAEGIEQEQEAETLHSLGVEYGQGYWLGRPAPAATWATPTRGSRSLRKAS